MNIRRSIVLCVLPALGVAAVALAEEMHWSYREHGGPAEWGSLSSEFAACKLGKLQSPIDIHDARLTKLSAIQFDYKPSTLKIIDNGHTIQVNYAAGSSIEVDGARYELVQFHFHRPSEEKINGKSYAMVAHLVHRNSAGKLAVIAVLLDKGGASQFIDTLWKNFPQEKGKEIVVNDITIDATKLLPQNRGYYTFQGSLTTPTCTEGVTWFVLKTPLKIADNEIAAFGNVYPSNARPVQPLNGRIVQATQ